MRHQFKPLSEQVIAITGASSGIGLTTAKLAANEGAKVFLISRNEEELRQICAEIRSDGGQAEFHACDVSDEEEMMRAAEVCEARFGSLDTWVNNAGLSIYGKVLDTPTEEARRLFETNYWGVLNGCKAAIPILRKKGGTLINIGSVLSEVSLPLQGIYSSSKFAVKGLTDALRRELQAEKAPISVSLVKPGAIDTPYPLHAGNHLGGEPVHTPPVYAPEVVARTILTCAQKPVREIGVGASAKIYPIMDRLTPKIQDFVMSHFLMEKAQTRSERSGKPLQTALDHAPAHEGERRGNYPGHVMKSSAYTELALRPWVSTSALLVGAGAVGYTLWRKQNSAATSGTPSRI